MNRLPGILIALIMFTIVAHSAHAAGSAAATEAGTASEHIAALKNHRRDAAALTEKIDKVSGFVAAAVAKPYRDPKGLKRTHWRMLLGEWQRELDATEAQIAWHTERLEQLQASGDEGLTKESLDQS